MSHDQPRIDRAPTSLTRRTMLTAAAWSAPAVAVVAAAPAYAATGPGVLVFERGSSSVDRIGDFYDLVLRADASVWANGGSSTPVTLTLTITFAATAGGNLLYFNPTPPAGWTVSPSAPTTALITYTRIAQITRFTTVVLPNASVAGTNLRAQRGTFQLTFAAPGFTSATAGFATPA